MRWRGSVNLRFTTARACPYRLSVSPVSLAPQLTYFSFESIAASTLEHVYFMALLFIHVVVFVFVLILVSTMPLVLFCAPTSCAFPEAYYLSLPFQANSTLEIERISTVGGWAWCSFLLHCVCFGMGSKIPVIASRFGNCTELSRQEGCTCPAERFGLVCNYWDSWGLFPIDPWAGASLWPASSVSVWIWFGSFLLKQEQGAPSSLSLSIKSTFDSALFNRPLKGTVTSFVAGCLLGRLRFYCAAVDWTPD